MAAVDVTYDQLDLQQLDDGTYQDVAMTKEEKDLQKILKSDRRRHKRVGGGVGFLCAVLALLNIAVPVYLSQSYTVEREQLVNRINNLTKEREDLKMRLCESGWQRFDRSCYYISTVRRNWAESREWCRDRLSDLIVIKSKEEQDFVASFNKRVWLGLTDSETEGSFQWVDGTPLTTPTYWMRGEPHGVDNDNPNAGEDCVEYYDGTGSHAPSRGWNDLRCYQPIYWMCERVVC